MISLVEFVCESCERDRSVEDWGPAGDMEGRWQLKKCCWEIIQVAMRREGGSRVLQFGAFVNWTRFSMIVGVVRVQIVMIVVRVVRESGERGER